MKEFYKSKIYEAMDLEDDELVEKYTRKYNSIIDEEYMNRLGKILALMVVITHLSPIILYVIEVIKNGK